MMYVTAFLLCFVFGPGLFWLIARRRATRPRFAATWGLSMFLIGTALALRHWIMPTYPDAPMAGIGVLLALWLAWILVLALAVMAIRARPVSFRLHRTAFALGAVGTTLPWFGLYAAQMVTQR
jgi:hypothetical protein